MALAVAAMAEREVNRIILTRPAVEAGERLGFLPGDLMAKVDPYLRPLFDALYDMLDADRVTSYMEKGQIEVAPLAFMRGRTLNDSFIILDEAQNTTPRADADVPDPARLRLEGRRHRRRDPDRPAARAGVGPDPRPRDPRSTSTGSSSSSSATRTSCATCSSSESSRPTRATPRSTATARGGSDRRRGREPKRRRGRRRGAAIALCREALAAEGVERRRSRLAFVGPDEMRGLKRQHLGIDEATDVLSFPIDGRDELPDGVPRQLGDVVLCPQVVGEDWRPPLVHGLLHLLGYDHGDEMEAARKPSSRDPWRSRAHSIIQSFNYAFEGVIHALRTSATCGSTSRSRPACSSSPSSTTSRRSS